MKNKLPLLFLAFVLLTCLCIFSCVGILIMIPDETPEVNIEEVDTAPESPDTADNSIYQWSVYEHDTDCTQYGKNLKLEYFTIKYPSDIYTPVSCHEQDPEDVVNYVDFVSKTDNSSNIHMNVGTFYLLENFELSYRSLTDTLIDQMLKSMVSGDPNNTQNIVTSKSVELANGKKWKQYDSELTISNEVYFLRIYLVPNFDTGYGVMVMSLYDKENNPNQKSSEIQEYLDSSFLPTVVESIEF